jgi:hypothetical protein
MKRWQLAAFFVLAFSTLLYAESQWQRSDDRDPDSGKAAERFVLEGTFINTPPPITTSDFPSLILICSEGKLVRQYAVVRIILWNGGVKIDMVADGGKKKTFSGDVMASRDPWVTGDANRRAFSTFDLRNVIAELLHGKVVRMAVQDYYGEAYRGTALPQLAMEFHIPDPSPIFAKCGLKP